MGRIDPSLNFVGKTSFAWAEGGWEIVPSLNFVGRPHALGQGGVGGGGG